MPNIHTAWGFGDDPLLFAHHINLATWARLSPSNSIYMWTPDGLPRHDDDMYYEAAKLVGLPNRHRHKIVAAKPGDTGLAATRRARKPAHISDFIRLWTLDNYGGWWLDTDVVVRHNPAKSGVKLNIGHEVGPQGQTIGLCNAIMYAGQPGLPAVKMWRTLQSQLFDPENWNGHSVGLPYRMQQQTPKQWHVWPNKMCLWPTWDTKGSMLIFGESNDPVPAQLFALHLWESNNMDRLRAATPDWFYTSQSLYAKLARKHA